MTLLDGTELKPGDTVRVKNAGRWMNATLIEEIKGVGVEKAVVELQGVKLVRSRYQIRPKIVRASTACQKR
jgi:hypothetical protein